MAGEISHSEEEQNAAEEFENKNKLEQWEIELIEKVNRIKTGESLAEAKFTDDSIKGLEKKSEFKKTEEGILLRKTLFAANEDKPIISEFIFDNKEQLVNRSDSQFGNIKNIRIDENGFIENKRIWDISLEKLKNDSEKDIVSKRANLSKEGFSDVEIKRLTPRQRAVTLRNILEDEDDFAGKIKELENKGIIEKEEK